MLLYPYSGNLEETGAGPGRGYTINIPLPRGLQDDDILPVYREILTPVVERYAPELILVVAGFDAHHEDPIGRMKLTGSAFAGLTRLLLNLRALSKDPPILFALEGGYSIRGLTDSVGRVLQVLTAPGSRRQVPVGGTDRAAHLIETVRRIHAACGVWVD